MPAVSQASHARKSLKAQGATRLQPAEESSFAATLRRSGGALIVTVPKGYIRDTDRRRAQAGRDRRL